MEYFVFDRISELKCWTKWFDCRMNGFDNDNIIKKISYELIQYYFVPKQLLLK